MSACPWCADTGYVERVRTCPCRAPEMATDRERHDRARRTTHDEGCQDGWVYIRVRCDHGRAS